MINLYTLKDPIKIDSKRMELVASALELSIEQSKPEILAVATANRFKHPSSDPFKDNPLSVQVLEANDPIFKVLLSYAHPFGQGQQRYCYIVDVQKDEGKFTPEHYHSLR